jgi:hypothetical protein
LFPQKKISQNLKKKYQTTAVSTNGKLVYLKM